jgi:hypothetical protein
VSFAFFSGASSPTFIIDSLEMPSGANYDDEQQEGGKEHNNERNEPVPLIPINFLNSRCKEI